MKLPAPFAQVRTVAFGSVEHRYFTERGWITHRVEGNRGGTRGRIPAGEMVFLTRPDPEAARA